MSRFPVAFRLTSKNRNSVAAVAAVLEAEIGETFEPLFLRPSDDWNGRGLLACSFTSPSAETVAGEVAAVRERHGAAALLVAGGPHASALPEATLAMGFDWVVTGEAGTRFADLVRRLAGGERPERAVLQEEPTPPIDRYPPWPPSGRLFAQIELTRGCPMGCTFCQTPRLFGRRPRHRSLASLERVFAHACATGHRYTRFVASNAFGYGSADGIHPEPRALAALLESARRAGFERVYLGTFPSEVRPESVTDEVLGLVRSLCDNDAIAIGMQSGSERMLRALRRGHTVAEGVRAIEKIAAAGFTPKVDFIFGLPGEEEEDRAASRQVVRQLVEGCGARVHAHLFRPLPGTPLADAAPTALDPETQALLGALAGEGRATGVAVGREED